MGSREKEKQKERKKGEEAGTAGRRARARTARMSTPSLARAASSLVAMGATAA